jgi:hypothetical protein
VPAATLTSAVSRKNCDLPLSLSGGKSEPRQGGITELRLTFDTPPGGPGTNPVSVEQATCAAPAFAPYSGTATLSATVAGNELVLSFSPGLENARTYSITPGPEVTSIAGQFVQVRGLLGDATADGLVNGGDRTAIIAVWTGSGFSCVTDVTNDGQTNGGDRTAIIAAWTSSQNCAP